MATRTVNLGPCDCCRECCECGECDCVPNRVCLDIPEFSCASPGFPPVIDFPVTLIGCAAVGVTGRWQRHVPVIGDEGKVVENPDGTLSPAGPDPYGYVIIELNCVAPGVLSLHLQGHATGFGTVWTVNGVGTRTACDPFAGAWAVGDFANGEPGAQTATLCGDSSLTWTATAAAGECAGGAMAAEGPGAELEEIIALLGVPADLCGSGCKGYARQMDRWGVDGCKARRAEIVGHLRDQQRQQRLGTIALAAARAVASGLALRLNPLDPLPGLVDLAIARAEAKGVK